MRTPSTTLRDLGIGLLGAGVPLSFLTFAEDAYRIPQLICLSLALLCLGASTLGEAKPLRFGFFEAVGSLFFLWRLVSWFHGPFAAGLSSRLPEEILQFGIFLWASQNLEDPIARLKVKRFVITGAIFSSIYGIVQSYGFDPFAAGRVNMGFAARAFASFGNPDFFGGYLILVIPFAIAKYLHTGKRPALVALFLLALVLTQTRAAWLGFAAGSTLLVYGSWADVQIKALGACAGMLLAFALILSFPNPLNPQHLSIAQRLASTADTSTADAGGRFFMSKVGLQIAEANPILGAGSGQAYTQAYLKTQGALLNQPAYAAEPYRYTNDIHNDWLQIAGEAGLPALLLFLLLWSGLIRRLLRQKAIEPLVISVVLVSFGVNALFHFPLAIVPSGALVWLFLGWGACVTRDKGWSLSQATRPLFALLTLLAFGIAVVQIGSLQSSVLLNRGMNLSLSHQLQAAQIPLLRAVTRGIPDERVAMRLGLNADEIGDSHAAKDYFQMALMLQPALPEALGNLGLSEAKLGQLGDGRRHCLESLAINPRSTEILGNLGKIDYLVDDVAGAEAAYLKGLDLDPAWSQGHFNLAAIYINTLRPALARTQLEALLKLEPGNAEAVRLLKSLK